MKYGYARVSTKGQEVSEQRAELVRAGAEQVVSEQVSGAVPAADRPGFKRLLGRLKAGDELLVTKLDRLGRSGLDIQRTVEALRDRDVSVTVLGIGTVRADWMGRLMLSMLAAFAEFERSTIIERMQGGRRAAQAKGVRMGRKSKVSPAAHVAISRRYQDGETGAALAAEYRRQPENCSSADGWQNCGCMTLRPSRPTSDMLPPCIQSLNFLRAQLILRHVIRWAAIFQQSFDKPRREFLCRLLLGVAIPFEHRHYNASKQNPCFNVHKGSFPALHCF